MKKIITLILGIALVYGCTSNSNDDSTNSTGLLVKTITEVERNESQTFNYNGNKIISIDFNIGAVNRFNLTFTYNGNFIISSLRNCNFSTNPSCYNQTVSYNYTNNILTSLNYYSSMSNYVRTFTYNSDGTVSENTTYQPSGTGSINYYIRYFSQGNCVREDEFRKINGVWTLQYTTTYTFDNKNNPFSNILGWYALSNPTGEDSNKNNQVGSITKNGSGQITNTNQTTHIYNSENYPIQIASTTTNYSVNPQTGVSTPGIPTTENITITYY